MPTPRLPHVILSLLVLAAAPARAGYIYFGDINNYIEASGQTVIATASTYEAVVLFKSTDGSGMVMEEIEPFGEDKFFEVAPASGVYGFNYPVNNPDVLFGPVANITLDTWHHVAYVYDGAEERLYFDGMLVGSRAGSGDVSDASGLAYIGASLVHHYTTFTGLLDSVRLSDVARYAGASFTPPTGDLTSDANTLLLYNFDDPAGSSTVTDSSPLGRTGTFGSLTGGPLPVPCGADTTDTDGDLIPDACDPDTPTTTTTIPSLEICDNCLDDDGDGDVDFEDADCCSAGQTATLTLKKGLIKPAPADRAKVSLAATLSASGLASGTTATQDVFLQLASDGGEVVCARVPAAQITRKKNGVVFKDPKHAVTSALGVDRLVVSQKKTGSGRLKAGGKQVMLTPPAPGPIAVVLGLRNPDLDQGTSTCAKGTATFHATKKGVLKFP